MAPNRSDSPPIDKDARTAFGACDDLDMTQSPLESALPDAGSECGSTQPTVTLPNEVFDRFYASLDEPKTDVPELIELLRAEPLPRG